MLRVDNRGEGGIIALLSLALPAGPATGPLLTVGLLGASPFFGDAMITPAISVLSALEGLKIATPPFEPYVVPLAVVILIGLFAIQSRGSGRVGRLFGPVTLAWFAMLALASITHVAARPDVLAALDPGHAPALLGRAKAARSSWWSARCSWRSPAPKRSTPTWATSAARRSASIGSRWSCRPSC